MGRFRLNQLRVRRLGGMTAVAAFALVMLAACGGGGEEAVTEDVTRVPVTSEAAGEATQAAVQEEEASTPAAAVIETEASPAAATPASAVTSAEATPAPAASPVAATTTGATPVTAATTAEATPMTATTTEATPEQTAATPVGATAGAAASPAATGAEASPAGAAASAESVEVVSHDIFFEPKELTIPADTDVTVSLPNEGVTLHNFSIDELGISVDLAPGATEEAVINAPAGTYEYYCNVPGHKEAGMVGTLTVA
jgi:uncharacterized cupredoxin-like copper-binding protein